MTRTEIQQRWRKKKGRAFFRNEEKKYRAKLRKDVFDHYGRKCANCGFDKDERALTIDHINGGGNQHRLSIGMGNFYKWLRKHLFPKGFQTLCANCQLIKAFEKNEFNRYKKPTTTMKPKETNYEK